MTNNIKLTANSFKSFALLIAILFTTPLLAKYNHEKIKVFTTEVAVNAQSMVDINHDKGSINVEYYDGAKMMVEVTLTVQGADLNDIEKVINSYTLSESSNGNQIKISSTSNIELWMTNSGGLLSKAKYKIRFKNGSEIHTQISGITAIMKVKIPKVKHLELSNKHEDIQLSDLPFSLTLSLLDGDLEGGNIQGNLDLNIKHGNGTLGNSENAEITLFDSELVMEDAGEVNLNCKHSDIEMGNMQSMRMTIFDSEVILKVVENNLDINEKHSRLTVDKMTSGKWVMFDSKVNLGEAKSLDINAKHGDYEIGNVDHIEIIGFDGRFEFKDVKSVSTNSFKHSTLKINKLDQSIKIDNAFDSNIDLYAISSSFSSLEFNGKHGSVNLPIPDQSAYQLDAELRHGSIDFNDSNFDFIKHVDKGVDKVIFGKSKNANDNSPRIKIRSESTDIDLTKL